MNVRQDLKIGGLYWCWWLHRLFYYDGFNHDSGQHRFVDSEDGQEIELKEIQLAGLETR